jgi:hypothetical protein
MSAPAAQSALYYPFHLCHERTLTRLLESYASIHFRDYMALQISPMSGTTAYMDRMGDRHGDLVKDGRIVQGYHVSGPLDVEMVASVNRDLADPAWRSQFHRALKDDRRFQRALFDLSHAMVIGGSAMPGPAALLRLIEDERVHRPASVQGLQGMSRRQLALEEGYDCEYALALVKTSAALAYTIKLSLQHKLDAATDSESHFLLLERTKLRDGQAFVNRLVPREGY